METVVLEPTQNPLGRFYMKTDGFLIGTAIV